MSIATVITNAELATLERVAGQFANRAVVMFNREGSEDIASRELSELAAALRRRSVSESAGHRAGSEDTNGR